MKKNFPKLNTILIIFLSLLYGFVPLCSLIGSLNDYDFIMNDSVMWASSILAIGGIVTVLMFIFTGKKVHKPGEILAAVSLLLPEINWILYGFIDFTSMVIVALTFVFAVVIWNRFAKPMILKVAVAVIAVIALPVLTLFSVVSFTYAENDIVVAETIDSPDGAMYAAVINETSADDTKHTYVNVRERDANIDFGCFEFSKKPSKVYSVSGESFENVDVEWNSNNVIVVNGDEFAL